MVYIYYIIIYIYHMYIYININIIRLSSSWDVHDVIIDLDHLGSWGSCWVEHNHGHRTMGLGDAHPLTDVCEGNSKVNRARQEPLTSPGATWCDNPNNLTQSSKPWAARRGTEEWPDGSGSQELVVLWWVLTSGGVGNLYRKCISVYIYISFFLIT